MRRWGWRRRRACLCPQSERIRRGCRRWSIRSATSGGGFTNRATFIGATGRFFLVRYWRARRSVWSRTRRAGGSGLVRCCWRDWTGSHCCERGGPVPGVWRGCRSSVWDALPLALRAPDTASQTQRRGRLQRKSLPLEKHRKVLPMYPDVQFLRPLGAKGRGSQDRSLGNPHRVGAGGNGESFQGNAGTVVGLELLPPLERNLFRQIAELVVAGLITPRAVALATNDRGVVVVPVPHMAVLAGVIDLFAGRENGGRILGLRRLQGDRAGID